MFLFRWSITWRVIEKPMLLCEETHCSTETYSKYEFLFWMPAFFGVQPFLLPGLNSGGSQTSWSKTSGELQVLSYRPKMHIDIKLHLSAGVLKREPSPQSVPSPVPSSWGGGEHQEPGGGPPRGRRCSRWSFSLRPEHQTLGWLSTTSGALSGSPLNPNLIELL